MTNLTFEIEKDFQFEAAHYFGHADANDLFKKVHVERLSDKIRDHVMAAPALFADDTTIKLLASRHFHPPPPSNAAIRITHFVTHLRTLSSSRPNSRTCHLPRQIHIHPHLESLRP